MTNLATAFRAGNGRKVKWNNQQVHSFVQVNVKDGDVIEMTRLSASPLRAQALKIATDRGNVRANGVLVPVAAVWTHTSPETSMFEVVGRRTRSIDIWNSWSADGVDSSWLGNAGMIVDGNSPAFTLRCSDGLGEATFDDLVMQVKVRHG